MTSVVDGGQVVDRHDDAIDAISAALYELSTGCEGESGRDLARRLRALEHVVRMAQGHVAAVMVEADRTDAYADDGHVSVRNWVMAETGIPLAEADHRSRTARLVAASPVVGDELRAGRVGVAAVREMARVRANPRIGDRLDVVVDDLLEEARTVPIHGFIQTLRNWAALVDADGDHRDHETAHARRRLNLTRLDGEPGGQVRGCFGAEQLAEIDEILQRYSDAEFDAEWADVVAEHGDQACPSMLTRTPAQRRADALVQALRDAAGRDEPSADQTPVVDIVTTVDVFEEQLRALIEDRAPLFDTASTRLRLCQTATGIPIDPVDAVVSALVGHVRRVVVDGTGRVVDVGRRRRLFTGAARHAALLQAVLDVTDGRCLWPGCGRRRRCQIDHITEWQHDGPTDLANAALLCGRHNRFKSHGYTIWRDPTGTWHITRPDGTQLGGAA